MQPANIFDGLLWFFGSYFAFYYSPRVLALIFLVNVPSFKDMPWYIFIPLLIICIKVDFEKINSS